MSDTYEGDLVRPLGLVTLYFAYAEGELDDLLEILCVNEPFDDAKQQWAVGRKITYAQDLIGALKTEHLAVLSAALDEARTLFNRRNMIVHSRIFSGGRLVSNRRRVADQRVTPEELTELAERIFKCKEHINVNRRRHLVPLLAAGG